MISVVSPQRMILSVAKEEDGILHDATVLLAEEAAQELRDARPGKRPHTRAFANHLNEHSRVAGWGHGAFDIERWRAIGRKLGDEPAQGDVFLWAAMKKGEVALAALHDVPVLEESGLVRNVIAFCEAVIATAETSD